MNTNFKYYIAIARPDHWIKSIFILPGMAIPIILSYVNILDVLPSAFLGIFSACFIASANYTINEWLDAEFDKFHPEKKNRPSVNGRVTAKGVYLQYTILSILGLGLARIVSGYFFMSAVALLIMGGIYNVKPLRTKDRPYLDVLSESINNPIRLLMGWFIVTSSSLPPMSLLVAYWMAGAFLMAVKRFSELRSIGDKKVAALYRASFQYYSDNSLLASILFYAMTFAFFFGIFLVKYRIELLISFPLFSIVFCWYLLIGMKNDSSAQKPEKLYKEKKLLFYIISLAILCLLLLYIKLPWLTVFLSRTPL